MSKLQNNIKKIFILKVTQKRFYFAMLSIYFLAMPNTNTQQIGLFAGFGYLAEFLFELPSGYLSDKIGHKKMLILSKIFMLSGISCFIHGQSIHFFIAGAICTSLSFAASSGSQTAFLHESLVGLKQENNFVQVSSKLAAYYALFNASVISFVIYTTQFGLKTPLYISLGFDIIGLVTALSLVDPPHLPKLKIRKTLSQIIKDAKESEFIQYAIFTGAITGFAITKKNFTSPYLESLGFPITMLGLLAGFSALLQFFVALGLGKYEEKINIKQMLFYDIFIFSGSFLAIALIENLYFIFSILVLVGAYETGRRSFVDSYLVKHHIKDKNYKATFLSIKGQISMFLNFILAFGIGYLMNLSYKLGFIGMGVILFSILASTIRYIPESKTEENKRRVRLIPKFKNT